MPVYLKTEIPEVISVNSIITVHNIHMTASDDPMPDIHDFWEIVFVNRGTFKILLEGELKTIKEGECIIYSPLALHIAAEKSEVDLKIITFDTDADFLKNISNKPMILSNRGKALLHETIDFGAKCFSHHKSNPKYRGMLPNPGTSKYEIQRIKKLLELVLLDLMDHYGTYQKEGYKNYTNHLTKLASDFSDYLKHNIGKSITLEEMADFMSISVSQLSALSKKKFGLSPLSYFISLKIDAAKRLIRDSELNFTEISERLGFNTVHYFSALFKRRVGMTPSEYSKSQN